jgi:hypothetical protein
MIATLTDSYRRLEARLRRTRPPVLLAGALAAGVLIGLVLSLIATVLPGAIAPLGTVTLSPGSALPGDAICAARVHRAAFEPRPENRAANTRAPTSGELASLAQWGPDMGLSPKADAFRARITGHFTGTTDEIIQWAACKWGFDVNVVRAQAVQESSWRQSTRGDLTSDVGLCPPGVWDGRQCYQSYGLLQIKYLYFASAWPMSRDDTAFNADFVLGVIRTCYEGWTTYLSERTPEPGYAPYHAGDLLGCLGRWFSGGWYDRGAITYIAAVRGQLARHVWTRPGF